MQKTLETEPLNNLPSLSSPWLTTVTDDRYPEFVGIKDRETFAVWRTSTSPNSEYFSLPQPPIPAILIPLLNALKLPNHPRYHSTVGPNYRQFSLHYPTHTVHFTRLA